MKEANSELYKNPKFYFDPMQQEVVDWTNTRAAMFVTSVTRNRLPESVRLSKERHN